MGCPFAFAELVTASQYAGTAVGAQEFILPAVHRVRARALLLEKSRTSSVMSVMKACVRRGGKVNLVLESNYPTPRNPSKDPKSSGEVLIKVVAAAINPVDYKVGRMMMTHYYHNHIKMIQ